MKETQKSRVIELLKERWYSNFEIQQAVKSSSADRTLRTIRENPPVGYVVKQREKEVPVGYNKCLEYKLCICD